MVTPSLGIDEAEWGDSGLDSASSEGGGVGGYWISHSTAESSRSCPWTEGSTRCRISREQFARIPEAAQPYFNLDKLQNI